MWPADPPSSQLTDELGYGLSTGRSSPRSWPMSERQRGHHHPLVCLAGSLAAAFPWRTRSESCASRSPGSPRWPQATLRVLAVPRLTVADALLAAAPST